MLWFVCVCVCVCVCVSVHAVDQNSWCTSKYLLKSANPQTMIDSHQGPCSHPCLFLMNTFLLLSDLQCIHPTTLITCQHSTPNHPTPPPSPILSNKQQKQTKQNTYSKTLLPHWTVYAGVIYSLPRRELQQCDCCLVDGCSASSCLSSALSCFLLHCPPPLSACVSWREFPLRFPAAWLCKREPSPPPLPACVCVLQCSSSFCFFWSSLCGNWTPAWSARGEENEITGGDDAQVSWYFEPSQPQRIILGLKTNFSLSHSHFLHKSYWYHRYSNRHLTFPYNSLWRKKRVRNQQDSTGLFNCLLQVGSYLMWYSDW